MQTVRENDIRVSYKIKVDTGKPITLGVRPEDIHQDQMFISNSPDTIVKARVEVIEKLGAETQIYCELDYEGKENSIIDNSTQMIAKISTGTLIKPHTEVELTLNRDKILIFDNFQAAANFLDNIYDILLYHLD